MGCSQAKLRKGSPQLPQQRSGQQAVQRVQSKREKLQQQQQLQQTRQQQQQQQQQQVPPRSHQRQQQSPFQPQLQKQQQRHNQQQQHQREEENQLNASQVVGASNINEYRSLDAVGHNYSVREGHTTADSSIGPLPRFNERHTRTAGASHMTSPTSSSFSALVVSTSVSASAPPQMTNTTTSPTAANTPAAREIIPIPHIHPLPHPQPASSSTIKVKETTTTTATTSATAMAMAMARRTSVAPASAITGTTPIQTAAPPLSSSTATQAGTTTATTTAVTGVASPGPSVLAAMAQFRGDRLSTSVGSDPMASPRRQKMNNSRTDNDDAVSVCVSSTSASSLQYFLQSRASGTGLGLHNSLLTPRLRHGMLSVTISPLSSTFVTPRMPNGMALPMTAAKASPIVTPLKAITTTTRTRTGNTTTVTAGADGARAASRAEGCTAGVHVSASRRESSISKNSTLGVSDNSNSATVDSNKSKDTPEKKKREWVPFSRTNSRHSSRIDLNKEEAKNVYSNTSNVTTILTVNPTPVNNNNNNNNNHNSNNNNCSENAVALGSKGESTPAKKGKDWVPFSRTNSRCSIRSNMHRDASAERIHRCSSVEVHNKKENHIGRKELMPSSQPRSRSGSMGRIANATTDTTTATTIRGWTNTGSPPKASNTRRGITSTPEREVIKRAPTDVSSCSVSSSSTSTVSFHQGTGKNSVTCGNRNKNGVVAPVKRESGNGDCGLNGLNEGGETSGITVPAIERFTDAIRGLHVDA
ncbi:hypothetical protein LSM04_001528 [Trypanosoma melophagium]|uniref:uncharacterized protein n=1 Tax=Trypanosoma melophagium TaxID=715481 RepID=UPI00351A1CFD|nr:hypothetical protein LSM04_001528 [Trypanosoma melophagium]